MVLKTRKWYQTHRLVKTRRLVPSVTILGQIFKLTYLIQYVPCYLLRPLVTSIFTWPNFFTKVVDLSTNYQMLLAVCRYDLWLSSSDGGPERPRPIPSLSEPARNRGKCMYFATLDIVLRTSSSKKFTSCRHWLIVICYLAVLSLDRRHTTLIAN